MLWSFGTEICCSGSIQPITRAKLLCYYGLVQRVWLLLFRNFKGRGRNVIVSRIEELEQYGRRKSLTEGSIPVTAVNF